MENKVELIGWYGGDETHAASAWTSTDHTKVETERHRIPALLKRLAEDGHHTPFEKSAVHFLVTTDIATHIHIIKHRTASVNAESARYKELKEDRYYWPSDWIIGTGFQDRKPDAPFHDNRELFLLFEEVRGHFKESYGLYHRLLAALEPYYGRKRAKESARYVLPYANQITADVMFDFRNFMHFQKLRNDDHAQLEIHIVADWMLKKIQDIPDKPFQYSLEAFGF